MAVPFAARSDAGRLIKHRASTNFNDDQPESSAKRLKRFASTDSSCPSDSSAEGRHTPDPDRTAFSSYFSRETNAATDDSRADHGDPAPSGSQTDLESVLPAVKTDQTAIEDYETSSLAEKDGGLTLEQRIESGKWVKGRSSIYVDAFNLALETVLEDEKHLFDEPELALFDQWRELPYEAQYLYVRLFLRKTSRWHRISRLGYYSDIADMKAAVECLREVRLLPPSTAPSEPHPGELEPPVDTLLGSTFRFADGSNDDVKTLEEASSLLDLDELKALAKDGKIQGKNKSELLKALRRTSQKQSSLGWSKLPRTDTESSAASSGGSESRHAASPTGGPNDPLLNRDEYYIRKILAWTGPCIRVALAPLRLFERVHLVFYRSTEWTEKSLTTLILARISRKNFPRYIISRSANIFASRALLLEFEAAIRTQFHVDSILEFNGNPTQEGLQQVLDVFDKVYPRWKILLQEEQAKEGTTYEIGEGTYLRRFSPAWVYTRIVHKAAYVLGRLKMHKREHDMLSELLDQQLFHPSRRGGWYQRKALLEEHYMFDLTPCDGRTQDSQKKRWKQIALHTCEEGLQDRDCHLIYHYDLQKRISKLERSLRVAKREQHDFGHARLVKPFERHVEGIRLQKESGVGNPKAIKRSSSSESNVTARGTKTTWIDDHDGGGECGVEEMCLSWYRQQGWKGYHCEGAIIRTLFGYLFHDVLFLYIPNVFQTAYQTCPLDLHTDTFYPTRMSEINHRLVEIANGAAPRLIRQVHEAESTQETCIVGLDWTFQLHDLLEIVECFDGEALATICKVLAQEYGQRTSGIPDLFLWHPDKREVMFAEVKSENDRLSDTQRLWIHVLTSASSSSSVQAVGGVSGAASGLVTVEPRLKVELCHAVAREVRVV